MAAITKWRALVNDVRRMPSLVQSAFRTATSGRPAPVYLDLPANVLCDRVDTSDYPILAPGRYRATTPPAASAALVEQAADMLVAANWPLIHTGGGVMQSGAWAEAVELAQHLSAPVTTSLGGRGAIPEDHPLCLIQAAPGAYKAQAEADVVLLVGGRLGALDYWGRAPLWGSPETQRLIQVDIEPLNIGLNRQVDLALPGDAKSTLRALLHAVQARTKHRRENPSLKAAREAQRDWLDGWSPGARSDAVPIHPLRLMREVRQFFPRNAISVVDGGNTAVWAYYQNRIYEPRSFLWAGDSGHLGTGVPYAVAAKLARPDLPVYCISGDGSFGFNAMEMETAAREKAPVVVVIANDRRWGMIRCVQKLAYKERHCGVDFSDARYDRLAQALGCHGERVTEPSEIGPALQRAADSGLPAVVDVIVDQEVHLLPPDGVVLDSIWMEGCDVAGAACELHE